MLMNKPCWLLLQLVSNINFLSPLSLAHSPVGHCWVPLYFTLRTLWGFLPGPEPPEITAIFTGHDCALKILRESNPGFPWHVGKLPSPPLYVISGHVATEKTYLCSYISRDPRWKMDLPGSARGQALLRVHMAGYGQASPWPSYPFSTKGPWASAWVQSDKWKPL